jgi:hypothetical protein
MPRAPRDQCGHNRILATRWDRNHIGISDPRGPGAACQQTGERGRGEIQPQGNGGIIQTRCRLPRCQPSQPGSAILTLRRRRLHSHRDYTATTPSYDTNCKVHKSKPLLHHMSANRCENSGPRLTRLGSGSQTARHLPRADKGARGGISKKATQTRPASLGHPQNS